MDSNYVSFPTPDPSPLLASRDESAATRRWRLVATLMGAAAAALTISTSALAFRLAAVHAGHTDVVSQFEHELTELRGAPTINCHPLPPPSAHAPSMPSFPPARVFPPGPPLPLYKPKDETHDIAIVVVTRHGERGRCHVVLGQ